jgi:hypothetical protein
MWVPLVCSVWLLIPPGLMRLSELACETHYCTFVVSCMRWLHVDDCIYPYRGFAGLTQHREGGAQ